MASAQQEFEGIEQTLDRALALAKDCQGMYLAAPDKVRRQFNQGFFSRVYVDDAGEVRTELAALFAVLLGEDLAREIEVRQEESTGQSPWRSEGFWEENR